MAQSFEVQFTYPRENDRETASYTYTQSKHWSYTLGTETESNVTTSVTYSSTYSSDSTYTWQYAELLSQERGPAIVVASSYDSNSNAAFACAPSWSTECSQDSVSLTPSVSVYSLVSSQRNSTGATEETFVTRESYDTISLNSTLRTTAVTQWDISFTGYDSADTDFTGNPIETYCYNYTALCAFYDYVGATSETFHTYTSYTSIFPITPDTVSSFTLTSVTAISLTATYRPIGLYSFSDTYYAPTTLSYTDFLPTNTAPGTTTATSVGYRSTTNATGPTSTQTWFSMTSTTVATTGPKKVWGTDTHDLLYRIRKGTAFDGMRVWVASASTNQPTNVSAIAFSLGTAFEQTATGPGGATWKYTLFYDSSPLTMTPSANYCRNNTEFSSGNSTGNTYSVTSSWVNTYYTAPFLQLSSSSTYTLTWNVTTTNTGAAQTFTSVTPNALAVIPLDSTFSSTYTGKDVSYTTTQSTFRRLNESVYSTVIPASSAFSSYLLTYQSDYTTTVGIPSSVVVAANNIYGSYVTFSSITALTTHRTTLSATLPIISNAVGNTSYFSFRSDCGSGTSSTGAYDLGGGWNSFDSRSDNRGVGQTFGETNPWSSFATVNFGADKQEYGTTFVSECEPYAVNGFRPASNMSHSAPVYSSIGFSPSTSQISLFSSYTSNTGTVTSDVSTLYASSAVTTARIHFPFFTKCQLSRVTAMMTYNTAFEWRVGTYVKYVGNNDPDYVALQLSQRLGVTCSDFRYSYQADEHSDIWVSQVYCDSSFSQADITVRLKPAENRRQYGDEQIIYQAYTGTNTSQTNIGLNSVISTAFPGPYQYQHSLTYSFDSDSVSITRKYGMSSNSTAGPFTRTGTGGNFLEFTTGSTSFSYNFLGSVADTNAKGYRSTVALATGGPAKTSSTFVPIRHFTSIYGKFFDSTDIKRTFYLSGPETVYPITGGNAADSTKAFKSVHPDFYSALVSFSFLGINQLSNFYVSRTQQTAAADTTVFYETNHGAQTVDTNHPIAAFEPFMHVLASSIPLHTLNGPNFVTFDKFNSNAIVTYTHT